MIKAPVIIGIAGGSGSGKTTFAKKVVEHFNTQISTLCHDFYYNSYANLSLEERKKQNFDHPNAFETSLMIAQLKKLKNGQSVERPVYSFTNFTRMPQTITVFPTKVIIVEGILIFENKELRDLMDIKIFVDTDDDIRFIRRMMRDIKSRGRTAENVVEQYISTVKPMHDTFVSPSKKYADIIVPEGGLNQVALDMVIHKVKSIL